MKLYLITLRVYFRVLSTVSPTTATKVAFKFFEKVNKLPIKPKEEDFYTHAKAFKVHNKYSQVLAYETGSPNGPVIFLVHGWESNAGSLHGINSQLVKAGYRVISLDLPAHGKHTGTHTNLLECTSALQSLINYIDPQEAFSVVSHSFGSAVTTFALSEEKRNIDQLIFLTSPNDMVTIFDDFGTLVGLNNNIVQRLKDHASQLLGQDLESFTVDSKGKDIDYNRLTLIHDRYDKVIPFANSQIIQKALEDAQLVELEKVGHYRMLWNEDVIKKIESVLAPPVMSI